MRLKNNFNIRRCGQANLVVIIFTIIMFTGIILLFLSFLQERESRDYMNLYAHNLLLSILRSDTGYLDEGCKLVSDVIACSFSLKPWKCGNVIPCETLARQKITKYLQEYGNLKKNYRYLFIVEPDKRIITYGMKKMTLKIGDESLENEKIEKIVANEKIQKIEHGSQKLLNVKIILAKK